MHSPYDVFDPHDKYFGNTNVKCSNGMLETDESRYGLVPSDVTKFEGGKSLDWLFSFDQMQDVRMGFLSADKDCNIT
jgi:hypothetical protein